MKIHRFWVSEIPDSPEATIESPEFVHQVKEVLQLKPGELIQLFNQQQERQAEIVVVTKKEIQVRLGREIAPLGSTQPTLHLAVSLLKGDSWEEIIRECTPLGIQTIQPLVCNRSIVRELTPGKLHRYQTIAKEATEQSGWRHVPEILPVQNYAEWVERCSAKQTVLFHHPGTPFVQIDLPQELTLVIGPEGGWTADELAQAERTGVSAVTLTEATLTARLAPVVACATALAIASQKS